jgi:hypothetical protein
MVNSTDKKRKEPNSKRRKRSNSKDAKTEDAALKTALSPKEQFQASARDESSDDEDADLMAAAAAWAARDSSTEEKAVAKPAPSAFADAPKSLHITQLPFDATDFDIRGHFVTQGVVITSLRMVYDSGLGGRKQFRGVAFIDVLDEDSFQAALKLNKSTLLKRRINVRPTRSKTELANIVERTKELVTDKIRKQKELKKLAESTDEVTDTHVKKMASSDAKKPKKDKAPRKEKADSKSPAVKKASKKDDSKPKPVVAAKEDGKSATTEKSTDGKSKGKAVGKASPAKKSSDVKLTKKERNKRAAIIMARRQR